MIMNVSVALWGNDAFTAWLSLAKDCLMIQSIIWSWNDHISCPVFVFF